MTKSIVLLALVLASTPALAQPPAGTVRYSDLDLTTANGVARLDRRIDRAVTQLCGSAFPTDLNGRSEVDRCRTETMKSVTGPRALLIAHAGGRGQLALKGR